MLNLHIRTRINRTSKGNILSSSGSKKKLAEVQEMEETEETANPIETGNISRKIISIAAGEAHTLALSGDGKVYSWGRGTFGRLGTGSEEDQSFPVRVRFFGPDDEREDKLHIVGIAAGAYHSLALADDGSVFGWGYNIYGQIGDTGENYSTPHLLDGFLGLESPDSSTHDDETENGKPLKISSIKAGGMMSMAIDNHGALWMWGNCPSPPQKSSSKAEFQLGSSGTPIPVWDFHGHTVVEVACGNEHVVALVSAGENHKGNDLICYSWGGNTHGQLGLGDTKSRVRPQVIDAFSLNSPWGVYDIACGAYHTGLLAKRKGPTDTLESVCFTFGLGDNGQLGHGTTQNLPSPEIVKGLPERIFLVSVSCGLFHTSVVSSAGEVWSWGMEKGLGLCPDARFTGGDAGDALSPLLIPCNGMNNRKFPEPTAIVCGAAHTVLVGDGGYKVWSWGRGRSGVLGNGRAVDCYVPTLVLWPILTDDFEQSRNVGPEGDVKEKSREGGSEMEKRLVSAMEEMKLLQSKYSVMERYASILHGSVFGKPFEENDIPVTLKNSGYFDIAKEWENMLESLDSGKLIRLEMFYRDMRAGVKDKLMKRRIQEIVKECINSTAARNANE